MSVVRLRPPDFAGGMNGAVITHSRSVKSDGARNPSRLCSRRAIPVHPIGSSISSTKTAESQDTGIAQQLLDRALKRQISLIAVFGALFLLHNRACYFTPRSGGR